MHKEADVEVAHECAVMLNDEAARGASVQNILNLRSNKAGQQNAAKNGIIRP